MPDYKDLSRRWIVHGGNLAHVMAMHPVTAPGSPSFGNLASLLLDKAGAVPAGSDDAAVLQESIRTGTPLRVDEDEEDGRTWCGDVSPFGHACTTYAGHGGQHSDDDGHEWPVAAPPKTVDEAKAAAPDLASDERVCWDPEIVVMGSICKWLEPLDSGGRKRVLAYLAHRYDVEIAPC